ncbi:hypothetical protein RCO48_34375 [Peribacillus frigoritolerans]|nr:hypothetical protein [Peribacillus frigoritolerans]
MISALVSLSAVVFSIFVLKESETAQVTQSMDAKTETMLRKIALSVKKALFHPTYHYSCNELWLNGV